MAEADPQVDFADLGVRDEIVAALAEVGITHPFPIQKLSIPIAIQGTDMIGQARTGTGKTLAFGVSLLQRIAVPGEPEYDELAQPGKPQALVLTPTRELALQVTRDLQIASTVRKARVLTVYGGVGYEPQLEALASGVDVVVGTPGRIIDLVNRRSLDLSYIRILVLDEADEMLDLGFLPDVETLIAKTPASRQTMLFSATMPAAIMALARMHLSHPVNLRAEAHDAQATVPDTTQFVYLAHDLDKPEIVAKLLQAPDAQRVMVFAKTKRGVQRLADDLEERGFSVTSIHGDLTQVAREKSLKRFRDGKAQVIVATDVAARGIDVQQVSHVVNFQCPEDEKTYIHRIGRTGRAGNTGVAVTLVDWPDATRWKVINRILDLPFTELAETYSTTPQLLEDLKIPAGTKGRIAPAAERPARSSNNERPRSQRPQSDRTRVRRRNGEVVRGDQDAVSSTASASTSESSTGEGRRRRRRRRSSGGPSDGQPAATSTS